MVTGDNPFTSIYIGRECNIIPEKLKHNVYLLKKIIDNDININS